MSISSTTRKAGPFAGNGIQTVFAFAFKLFLTSDALVTRAVAGVETVLTLGVDYTVSLNADQEAAPGGNVTLTAALAVGATLAITSNVDALQSVVVTNAGGFFPSVFNTVFDKLTILIQQLIEKMGRALVIPVTSSGVTSLTVPVLNNGVLQWKSDGSALQAILMPDLSLQLALPSMTAKTNWLLGNNGAAGQWQNFTPTFTGVGGVTVAFPALKRNGAVLEVKLGDDSGYAGLTVGGLTVLSGLAVTGTITQGGQALATQAFAVAAAVAL